MSKMEQLPVELLLLIATHLGDQQRTRDLRNFALTCRQLRGAAQEILLQAPKLYCQRTEGTCSSTSLLVRTMLERPDLAKKLRHLSWDMSRFSYPSEHMPRMALNTAGLVGRYGTVSRACKKFVERSQLALNDWIDAIEGGTEGAYIGACLAFVPCLDTLEITVPFKRSQSTTPAMDAFFSQRIDFMLEHIPAFRNLTSFTTNLTPPWEIVLLPTLRHLQIGLHSPAMMLRYLPADAQQLNIHSLVLLVPDKLLLHTAKDGFWFGAHRRYMPTLLHLMGSLEHLALRIAWHKQYWSHDVNEESGWDALLSYVPPLQKLVSLEIDITEEEQDGRLIDCVSRRALQAARLRAAPCKSLEHFSALKRLVVPQGVVASDTEDPKHTILPNACLPTTLQEIGIIDSTHLFNQWAQDVLLNCDHFLALKRIDLWCDRTIEPLQQAEEKITKRKKLNRPLPISSSGKVYSRAPMREGHSTEEPTSPRQLERSGIDGVWEELRESGVEMTIHGREERFAWRRYR